MRIEREEGRGKSRRAEVLKGYNYLKQQLPTTLKTKEIDFHATISLLKQAVMIGEGFDWFY